MISENFMEFPVLFWILGFTGLMLLIFCQILQIYNFCHLETIAEYFEMKLKVLNYRELQLNVFVLLFDP